MQSFIALLLSIFSRRRSAREIFAYWDGAKQRHIDPLSAWRAIWSHPEIDLSHEIKVTANPQMAEGIFPYTPEEVCEAEDKIRQLAREVFGVKAWSEDVPGLTVGETDELLNKFMAYIGDLKKKRKPLPMTPPASVSMPPPISTASENSPTSSPSESGSTASESSAAAPSG